MDYSKYTERHSAGCGFILQQQRRAFNRACGNSAFIVDIRAK